ncbi:MAG: ribosome silencing factor [Syntrophomonadaceae bacterium]|nr:ribosome silencing factor [Syntrophomonadaceae bacterium]MDD3022295.1 ribosome silencing factor [Syntrophomonadaceae bacterium]
MIEHDKLVQLVADACLDEKASDLIILNVSDLTIIADYFVIASGRSTVQVKSIVEHVEEKLEEQGVMPIRKEGHEEGLWGVMDYGSTILHVFRQQEREYYKLENLWGEAMEVAIEAQ